MFRIDSLHDIMEEAPVANKQYRRRKTKTFRILVIFGLFFTLYSAVALGSVIGINFKDDHERERELIRGKRSAQENQFSNAHYNEEERNCTPRSLEEFPSGAWSFTYEERKSGWVALPTIVVLYIFGALAIVCDDYFVSSLEYICDALKLQPDVAGATFMAAGSSAPELFISIIGVFFAPSDVGVGTIVGSAVFNILFIIGLCGLGAGMAVSLTWWPLFRDISYYTLSVIGLIVVIYDGKVIWQEASVFLGMYVLYVIFMFFNPRVGKFWTEKVAKWRGSGGEGTEYELSESPVHNNVDVENIKGTFHRKTSTSVSVEHNNSSMLDRSPNGYVNKSYNQPESPQSNGTQIIQQEAEGEEEEDEEGYESPWLIPDGCVKKILWIIMLPVTFFFFITIPDCRRDGCWKKLYVITFIASILWIAGLSYVMVWMVAIIGDTAGIPDSVMGLTLLAAGTSIPDAMASLFVARDGYGDMAVSNSIGSNIFDILIGLGLPWIIQTAIVDRNSIVPINSGGLVFSSISLLVTVLFLLVLVVISKWKLNVRVGIVCMLVYVIFLVMACLNELNVFGDVNLPTCPRVE